MSARRSKQVDTVRLRLLPEKDRARLALIATVHNQSMSTVLRKLDRRFGGDVGAYYQDHVNRLASRLPRRRRTVSAAELAQHVVPRERKPV